MSAAKVIIRKFKISRASFKGKNNASKIKALLVLYMVKNEWHKRQGIGVAELAQISGVSYKYLKARLKYWHWWAYVYRHGRERPYSYTICERGERFIESIVPRPLLDGYIAEIRRHNGW